MREHQEPQHIRALRLANDVRLKRAELKRRIKRGEVSPAIALEAVESYAAGMSLGQLLKAQHRWSTRRTELFLRVLCADCPSGRTPEALMHTPLGRLTERERTKLIGALSK